MKVNHQKTRFTKGRRALLNLRPLVKAKSPVTGRTHQLRVHTLHADHPIAFDDRLYGDR